MLKLKLKLELYFFYSPFSLTLSPSSAFFYLTYYSHILTEVCTSLLFTESPSPFASFSSALTKNTDTHPLSSFSLLMLSFSCCSFSSISSLSWARVTVSICSSCRFLWQHAHTHTHSHICNQSRTINHTNDLLCQIGQPGFHQYVQFICCTSRSLLP